MLTSGYEHVHQLVVSGQWSVVRVDLEKQLLATDHWPLTTVLSQLTPRLALVNVLRHRLPNALDATFDV
jgi:hypothetical protein